MQRKRNREPVDMNLAPWATFKSSSQQHQITFTNLIPNKELLYQQNLQQQVLPPTNQNQRQEALLTPNQLQQAKISPLRQIEQFPPNKQMMQLGGVASKKGGQLSLDNRQLVHRIADKQSPTTQAWQSKAKNMFQGAEQYDAHPSSNKQNVVMHARQFDKDEDDFALIGLIMSSKNNFNHQDQQDQQKDQDGGYTTHIKDKEIQQRNGQSSGLRRNQQTKKGNSSRRGSRDYETTQNVIVAARRESALSKYLPNGNRNNPNLNPNNRKQSPTNQKNNPRRQMLLDQKKSYSNLQRSSESLHRNQNDFKEVGGVKSQITQRSSGERRHHSRANSNANESRRSRSNLQRSKQEKTDKNFLPILLAPSVKDQQETQKYGEVKNFNKNDEGRLNSQKQGQQVGSNKLDSKRHRSQIKQSPFRQPQKIIQLELQSNFKLKQPSYSPLTLGLLKRNSLNKGQKSVSPQKNTTIANQNAQIQQNKEIGTVNHDKKGQGLQNSNSQTSMKGGSSVMQRQRSVAEIMGLIRPPSQNVTENQKSSHMRQKRKPRLSPQVFSNKPSFGNLQMTNDENFASQLSKNGNRSSSMVEEMNQYLALQQNVNQNGLESVNQQTDHLQVEMQKGAIMNLPRIAGNSINIVQTKVEHQESLRQKNRQEAIQRQLLQEQQKQIEKATETLTKKEFAAVRLNIEDKQLIKKGPEIGRLNSMSTVNQSLLDLQTKHQSNQQLNQYNRQRKTIVRTKRSSLGAVTPHLQETALNKSQSSIEFRQGTASSYPSQVDMVTKLKPNLNTNADLMNDLSRDNQMTSEKAKLTQQQRIRNGQRTPKPVVDSLRQQQQDYSNQNHQQSSKQGSSNVRRKPLTPNLKPIVTLDEEKHGQDLLENEEKNSNLKADLLEQKTGDQKVENVQLEREDKNNRDRQLENRGNKHHRKQTEKVVEETDGGETPGQTQSKIYQMMKQVENLQIYFQENPDQEMAQAALLAKQQMRQKSLPSKLAFNPRFKRQSLPVTTASELHKQKSQLSNNDEMLTIKPENHHISMISKKSNKLGKQSEQVDLNDEKVNNSLLTVVNKGGGVSSQHMKKQPSVGALKLMSPAQRKIYNQKQSLQQVQSSHEQNVDIIKSKQMTSGAMPSIDSNQTSLNELNFKKQTSIIQSSLAALKAEEESMQYRVAGSLNLQKLTGLGREVKDGIQDSQDQAAFAAVHGPSDQTQSVTYQEKKESQRNVGVNKQHSRASKFTKKQRMQVFFRGRLISIDSNQQKRDLIQSHFMREKRGSQSTKNGVQTSKYQQQPNSDSMVRNGSQGGQRLQSSMLHGSQNIEQVILAQQYKSALVHQQAATQIHDELKRKQKFQSMINSAQAEQEQQIKMQQSYVRSGYFDPKVQPLNFQEIQKQKSKEQTARQQLNILIKAPQDDILVQTNTDGKKSSISQNTQQQKKTGNRTVARMQQELSIPDTRHRESNNSLVPLVGEKVIESPSPEKQNEDINFVEDAETVQFNNTSSMSPNQKKGASYISLNNNQKNASEKKQKASRTNMSQIRIETLDQNQLQNNESFNGNILDYPSSNKKLQLLNTNKNQHRQKSQFSQRQFGHRESSSIFKSSHKKGEIHLQSASNLHNNDCGTTNLLHHPQSQAYSPVRSLRRDKPSLASFKTPKRRGVLNNQDWQMQAITRQPDGNGLSIQRTQNNRNLDQSINAINDQGGFKVQTGASQLFEAKQADLLMALRAYEIMMNAAKQDSQFKYKDGELSRDQTQLPNTTNELENQESHLIELQNERNQFGYQKLQLDQWKARSKFKRVHHSHIETDRQQQISQMIQDHLKPPQTVGESDDNNLVKVPIQNTKEQEFVAQYTGTETKTIEIQFDKKAEQSKIQIKVSSPVNKNQKQNGIQHLKNQNGKVQKQSAISKKASNRDLDEFSPFKRRGRNSSIKNAHHQQSTDSLTPFNFIDPKYSQNNLLQHTVSLKELSDHHRNSPLRKQSLSNKDISNIIEQQQMQDQEQDEQKQRLLQQQGIDKQQKFEDEDDGANDYFCEINNTKDKKKESSSTERKKQRQQYQMKLAANHLQPDDDIMQNLNQSKDGRQ